MTLQIISVSRPTVFTANNVHVDAEWLNVDFIDTGTTVNVTACLPFSEYAGLEAEFLAASASTVLDTAIQTWITGATIQVSDPETPPGGGGGGKDDQYQL